MRTTIPVGLLPIMLGLAGAAQAEGPTVNVSGFGTAAVAISDTDDAQYTRTRQQAGVGKSLRTGLDSNLGVQATATFSDSLSFTAQVLNRKIVRDHFGAELAWAFAKFKVNDKLALRIGRMGLPVYMISDFRDVGYANTMIRPSNEVYSLVPTDSIDGIDAIYQGAIGATALTTQLSVGRTSPRLPGGTKSVMKPVIALNVVAENGPLSVRFGHSLADFSIEGNAFISTLGSSLRAAGFPDAAADVQHEDVRGSFTSIGAVYDQGSLLLQGEYSIRRTDTMFVADSTGWYALAGYRVGKVMPYAAYGKLTQDSARSYGGVPPTVQPFNAILNGIAKSAQQSTATVGVRWDFASSMAFKFQADRLRPRDGAGTLSNVKPGFSGPVTVVAAGVDFVF